MSTKSKHFYSTWRNDIARKFPKRNCSGTLIHCVVTYRPGGPTNEELECSQCSYIRKDKRFNFKYKHLYQQPSQRQQFNRGPDKYRNRNGRDR
ncbi:MAG TPA: hypothetical protein VKR58_10220 [Aquella sp.]|nr:hypothetical protein [Aquella sp.]